jgi:hypothetical protein
MAVYLTQTTYTMNRYQNSICCPVTRTNQDRSVIKQEQPPQGQPSNNSFSVHLTLVSVVFRQDFGDFSDLDWFGFL